MNETGMPAAVGRGETPPAAAAPSAGRARFGMLDQLAQIYHIVLHMPTLRLCDGRDTSPARGDMAGRGDCIRWATPRHSLLPPKAPWDIA